MAPANKRKKHARRIAKQGGLARGARARAQRQAAGKEGPVVYQLAEVCSKAAPLKVPGEQAFQLVDGDRVLVHYQPPLCALSARSRDLPKIQLGEWGFCDTAKCSTMQCMRVYECETHHECPETPKHAQHTAFKVVCREGIPWLL
jgi:hypothetical protein